MPVPGLRRPHYGDAVEDGEEPGEDVSVGVGVAVSVGVALGVGVAVLGETDGVAGAVVRDGVGVAVFEF